MIQTSTIEGVNVLPEDLCDQAIKLARRVQGLEYGKAYLLEVTKMPTRWELRVYNDGQGVKVEVLE